MLPMQGAVRARMLGQPFVRETSLRLMRVAADPEPAAPQPPFATRRQPTALPGPRDSILRTSSWCRMDRWLCQLG